MPRKRGPGPAAHHPRPIPAPGYGPRPGGQKGPAHVDRPDVYNLHERTGSLRGSKAARRGGK